MLKTNFFIFIERLFFGICYRSISQLNATYVFNNMFEQITDQYGNNSPGN